MSSRSWVTMAGMYLGKERRDRTVALVLAAALVGAAVLGLLVTVASGGAGASGAQGTPYAAPTPSAADAPAADDAATVVPPVGQEVHAHGDLPPVDPGDGGHPWRLVGTLVGVVLLFGCGILVAREQQRRAEDGGASGGPGEWIS